MTSVLQKPFGPRRCNLIVLPVAIIGQFRSYLLPARRTILSACRGIGGLRIVSNFLRGTSNCRFCGADQFAFRALLTSPSGVRSGFQSCLSNFSTGTRSILTGFSFSGVVGQVMRDGALCLIVGRFNSRGNCLNPSGVDTISYNCVFRSLMQQFSRDFNRRTKTRFADQSVVCLVASLLLSRTSLSADDVAICSVTVNADRVLDYVRRHVRRLGDSVRIAYFKRRFGPSAFTVTGTSVVVHNNSPGGVQFNSALSRSRFPKFAFRCVVSGPPFNVS